MWIFIVVLLLLLAGSGYLIYRNRKAIEADEKQSIKDSVNKL